MRYPFWTDFSTKTLEKIDGNENYSRIGFKSRVYDIYLHIFAKKATQRRSLSRNGPSKNFEGALRICAKIAYG